MNRTANCTFTPSFKLLKIDKTLIYLPLNSYGFALENDQRHVAHNVARSNSFHEYVNILLNQIYDRFGQFPRVGEKGGVSLLPWRFLMFPKDWPGSIRARPRGITADQGHWFSKPAELLPGNVSTTALIKPENTPSSPPRHRSSPGCVRPRVNSRGRSPIP